MNSANAHKLHRKSGGGEAEGSAVLPTSICLQMGASALLSPDRYPSRSPIAPTHCGVSLTASTWSALT